jgi:hypothetical protein
VRFLYTSPPAISLRADVCSGGLRVVCPGKDLKAHVVHNRHLDPRTTRELFHAGDYGDVRTTIRDLPLTDLWFSCVHQVPGPHGLNGHAAGRLRVHESRGCAVSAGITITVLLKHRTNERDRRRSRSPNPMAGHERPTFFADLLMRLTPQDGTLGITVKGQPVWGSKLRPDYRE